MIDKCSECFNTDLYRDKNMIVCKRCGNLLEEHIQFAEKYSEFEDHFSAYDYKLTRWKSILSKIEEKFGIIFDSFFVEHLSQYIVSFVNNFNSNVSGRKNMISYKHLIYRFCQQFGYDKYLQYFSLSKTKYVITRNDLIIKKINTII